VVRLYGSLEGSGADSPLSLLVIERATQALSTTLLVYLREERSRLPFKPYILRAEVARAGPFPSCCSYLSTFTALRSQCGFLCL